LPQLNSVTRELIQRIVEAESEGGGIVASAREEADRILDEARHQAESLVSSSLRRSRGTRREIISAAVDEGKREKQERLARVARDVACEVTMHEQVQRRVVDAVVRCVSGLPEAKGEG
jgi:vacuolar-type H+-ATPase subunit H